MKKKSRARKGLLIAAVILLAAAAACGIYLGDYYHGDAGAVTAFTADDPVQMRVSGQGDLVWEPEEPVAGLIFYPGGKVEHTAYAPLMGELASRGILCVLVEMPFRLAVFDMDAAAGIREAYPQVENWYMGGHSLGGSMAAAYLADCTEPFDGLILLGSYSTADLSGMELDVLSIRGSEDMVLNKENYDQSMANLPGDFRELVIDGGCHAYFGVYGPQEGDGTPTVTNEEQIIFTADAIAAMVGE